jgi:hypothetical protein
VFRADIAHLALAWLPAQVAGKLFSAFGFPDWGVRFTVILTGRLDESFVLTFVLTSDYFGLSDTPYWLVGFTYLTQRS